MSLTRNKYKNNWLVSYKTNTKLCSTIKHHFARNMDKQNRHWASFDFVAVNIQNPIQSNLVSGRKSRAVHFCLWKPFCTPCSFGVGPTFFVLDCLRASLCGCNMEGTAQKRQHNALSLSDKMKILEDVKHSQELKNAIMKRQGIPKCTTSKDDNKTEKTYNSGTFARVGRGCV